MISPRALHLLIQHFDAIDEAVSGRLARKRPWSEPALTSLLCDLLDQESQDETSIRYPVTALNKDLADLDGLLRLRFELESHEYEPEVERWVTQADIGLVLRFEDLLLPDESWSLPFLLQAKRLYADHRNPTSYSELSRFRGYDDEQKERMEELEKAVGISFVKFLLYCPRPSSLDLLLQRKLAHLRNRALADDIFDYTLGLETRDALSSRESTIAAGLFVSDLENEPKNLGHIHSGVLGDYWPFAWFITKHLCGTEDVPLRRSRQMQRRMRNPVSPSDAALDWAEGIVTGQEAIPTADGWCGNIKRCIRPRWREWSWWKRGKTIPGASRPMARWYGPSNWRLAGPFPK